MATEIVLLSEVAPSFELLTKVGNEVLASDHLWHFKTTGISQYIKSDGSPVLTVFPSIAVHDATEAKASIQDAPDSLAIWTEMTVPYGGDQESATALVRAIATDIHGTIHEKV